MDLRLYAKQAVRIITHDILNESNFIDVRSLDFELGLMITNYSLGRQYIELRRKDNQIALLLFSKKSHKKDVDLGYWSDADIIFSLNEVEH